MSANLDPQPWLFISDQVFGEHRSAVDEGFHGVSGAYWVFKPRTGYEQDRVRYEQPRQKDTENETLLTEDREELIDMMLELDTMLTEGGERREQCETILDALSAAGFRHIPSEGEKWIGYAEWYESRDPEVDNPGYAWVDGWDAALEAARGVTHD